MANRKYLFYRNINKRRVIKQPWPSALPKRCVETVTYFKRATTYAKEAVVKRLFLTSQYPSVRHLNRRMYERNGQTCLFQTGRTNVGGVRRTRIL